MTVCLKISEKEGWIDYLQFNTYQWCSNYENQSSRSWDTLTPSEQVWYDTKLVVMATSLEESEKTGRDQKNSRKYLPFGEKIVKIGQVDTEIALLIVKKEEINASKIYIPVSNLAERAKWFVSSWCHCHLIIFASLKCRHMSLKCGGQPNL